MMLLLVLFLSSIISVYCGNSCPGALNNNPIWNAEPTLVKTVKNGKLFIVGNQSDLSSTYVIHMFGTPYEMGYAHGLLVGDKIKTFLQEVNQWLEVQLEQQLPYLPEFLANIIVEYGLEAGLEMTYWMTEAYTPQYYFDEMRGLADASGIPYMDIVRINLFPELIKASCSMIGAWGDAIGQNNSGLYQLRALDWATNGPFQKYASLLVYHPSMPNANSFVNYGFTGFIGALTGISSQPIGICEKVWLKYNGTSSRFGQPWHFVLRDILLWDKSVDDAVNRVNQAKRTCSIFVGVGDLEFKFRAMMYSHEYVNVYDDANYPVYQNHPRMKGYLYYHTSFSIFSNIVRLVYINKHTQPSTDPCMANLLKSQYGSINALSLIQIAAQQETGDTHAAVYDYGKRIIYFSAASPQTKSSNAIPAYKRQWAQLSLDALWAVTNN